MLALAVGIAPVGMASAEECSVPIEGVKAAIDAFRGEADKRYDSAKSSFKSATSSKYQQDYYEDWNKVNDAADDDTTKYVVRGYDLSGSNFSGQLAKGKIQTALPPKVTLSMENALELAEAAADDSNTKVDLAALRCSQNTEDAALAAAMEKLGGDTVENFRKAKKRACKLVTFAADLQNKKEQLDEIRTEGYPLFHLEKKDTKDFAGLTRTIQIRVDLRMYPEYPEGANQDFLLGQLKGINLAYNSYFKWSDNSWTKLNLYEYLIGEGKDEGEICYPQIKLSSSVKVATCFKFTDVSSSSVTMRVRGKFWYNGESGTVKLIEQTIPAPFGYLADVSDMKEKKMQDLQNTIISRIADMMGEYGEMIEKAQEWKESCSS